MADVLTALLAALLGAMSPLWRMSLTAAYAAVVVALLRLVLKRRAPRQVLCLLWLVVFARLLAPVSLESPLSIIPDAQQVQRVQNLPARLTGGEQTVPSQNPAPGQEPPQNTVQGHEPAQNPAQSQPAAATGNPSHQGDTPPALTVPENASPAGPQAEPAAASPWLAVLAGSWLAGVAAMVIYGLAAYLRLKGCLYDAIRAEDGAWEHPAVDSPFILGVFQPRIYLPAGLCGQARRFILCHERAHLRRLDHIVKPVCWMALALHWFNPFVWMAYILMSQDIETACDEAVIRRLGPRVKADYSATLLSLATRGRVPGPCPLAFDEGNAKGRIRNVLNYRRPALWIVVVSAVAAVLAAVCLLTDPMSDEAPEDDPNPDASDSQPPGEGLNTLLDPWMESVLAGQRNFTSAEGGEQVNIDLLNGAYPEDAPFTAVTLSKFAVVDLDRDGVSELILWPSIDGDDSVERISTLGYLILRRQGDEVTSYNPSYRSFAQVKTDGTFDWGGSSHYWGWGTLSFTETECVVNQTTWRDSSVEDDQYFINGLKVTPEEFDAAYAAQSAKPDLIWYVFEDGRLNQAPINKPIPLDDYALNAAVPDFLDGEQQLLYRQMNSMYRHLFGGSTSAVCRWDTPEDSPYDGTDTVERNGTTYVGASGRYARWSDFEEAVLSVFSQEFWESRNNWGDGGTPVFLDVDDRLYFIDADRGNHGYNYYFPETFRLVERTDDTISFVMTGYYSETHLLDGETSEQREARLAAGWEYSIDYPMRMVKTENGWRFDEFYCAWTDRSTFPFYNQGVPNPNAPAPETSPEPSAEPEPSPTPSAAPMACEHGLDDIRLEYVGSQLAAVCSQDGFTYLIPGVTAANYQGTTGQGDGGGWLREDLDGDGHMEVTVFTSAAADSGMVVLDVENGAAISSSFSARQITDLFNANVAYDYLDDLTILEVSYDGYTAQCPVSDGWRSEMLNRGGGWNPEIWPTEVAGVTWSGGGFLYRFDVFCARGYSTGITTSWSVTYGPDQGLRVSGIFYMHYMQ